MEARNQAKIFDISVKSMLELTKPEEKKKVSDKLEL